jgi:hypothetical protein
MSMRELLSCPYCTITFSPSSTPILTPRRYSSDEYVSTADDISYHQLLRIQENYSEGLQPHFSAVILGIGLGTQSG